MALVILCDMLKAMLAVWIGSIVFGNMMPEIALVGKYWAALFCLLGHMFPCMFEFKGGKGILSGGTIALMIDWRIALVVWGGFIILFLLTRYVSLGSVWAGASFPFISWYCYPDPIIVVLAFLCGGLVVWKHRSNIKRLLNGTESKFQLRSGNKN
jgi:glycerol-3-phosphate acyltransferase PlsY